MTTSRLRRVIGVASLTASLVVSMGAVASFAEPPVQELVDVRDFATNPYLNYPANNPDCGWFYGTDDETPFDTITKFDPISGEVTEPPTEITQDGITITVTDDKGNGEITEFSWDSGEINVIMVIVKAGDGANLYVYAPDGATGGTGLVTVTDAQGTHGVSHVTFCAGSIDEEEEEEEPDPNIAPTASVAAACATGVVVTLDNTATDDDDTETDYTTTYTVVVNVNDIEVHNAPHNVIEGADDEVTASAPLEHGDKWDATITAEGMDPVEASGTAVCPPGNPDLNPIPNAAFNHACTADNAGVATVTLTNTGDADAEFTVASQNGGSAEAQKVTVAPGGTEVEAFPMSDDEVLDFVVTSGEGEWTYSADNDPCVTEVQGVVLENDPPTPDPAPAPAPEPQVQGDQLAATGLESPDLLLLAMLFAGLGLALLLSTSKPDPLMVRIN